METLKQENDQLKLYLAEAIKIANFTIRGNGLFIKKRLWELKTDQCAVHVAGTIGGPAFIGFGHTLITDQDKEQF